MAGGKQIDGDIYKRIYEKKLKKDLREVAKLKEAKVTNIIKICPKTSK